MTKYERTYRNSVDAGTIIALVFLVALAILTMSQVQAAKQWESRKEIREQRIAEMQ